MQRLRSHKIQTRSLLCRTCAPCLGDFDLLSSLVRLARLYQCDQTQLGIKRSLASTISLRYFPLKDSYALFLLVWTVVNVCFHWGGLFLATCSIEVAFMKGCISNTLAAALGCSVVHLRPCLERHVPTRWICERLAQHQHRFPFGSLEHKSLLFSSTFGWVFRS